MLLKKCSPYKSYFVPFSFNCLCQNIKSTPFSMEKKIYSNLVEFQSKNNRILSAIKMSQKWYVKSDISVSKSNMKRARLSSINRIHSHSHLTLFLEWPLFYSDKKCAEPWLVRHSAGESTSLDVSSPLNPWFENEEPDAVPSLYTPNLVLLLWDGK